MEMVRKLQQDIHGLKLENHQDLSSYINEVRDLNRRRSFAGKAICETWLVNIFIHQLSASRYKASIETLTAVHTACHT